MIKYSGGHYRSYREPSEEEQRLKRDLDSLTPEEATALREILSGGGSDRMFKAAQSMEFEREPVDMHTFIYDPYYLGNSCDLLYPQLAEDLTELFRGGYNECVLTGAIGFGKTFAASIGVIRIIYELSCLKNPHESLGIADGTNISIVAFSVNEGLAMKVVLENIATKVGSSPYFNEKFPYEVTKKEMRFPHNIWVAARASTDTSALGLNVISAVLDEANFQHTAKSATKVGPPVDRAQTLYNQIKRRLKSRFERNGKTPGMLFLISSKSSTNDFTERRIIEGMDGTDLFVRDYPLWGPKPESYFSDETFTVMVGSDTETSGVLTDESAEEFRLGGIPEGCTLVEVPENFRVDFEADLESSIRDIAGISTVAISPFIQRRDKILKMFEAVEGDPDLFHPFSTMELNPSVGGKFKWADMVEQKSIRVPGSGGQYEAIMQPKIHPDSPRAVHVDIGVTTDSLGICIAHVGAWVDLPRRSPDGAIRIERLPVYYVDMALEVVPPVGGEIFIPDVKTLVLEFYRRGYPIVSVTSDSYQSTALIQEINRAGIHSEVLSVDRTMDPYQTLKSAIYDGRVRCYPHPKLRKELTKLQIDLSKPARPKVDHPSSSSKDLSDSLAGAIYTLSEKASSLLPLPPPVRGTSGSHDIFSNEAPDIDSGGPQGVIPILFG